MKKFNYKMLLTVVATIVGTGALPAAFGQQGAQQPVEVVGGKTISLGRVASPAGKGLPMYQELPKCKVSAVDTAANTMKVTPTDGGGTIDLSLSTATEITEVQLGLSSSELKVGDEVGIDRGEIVELLGHSGSHFTVASLKPLKLTLGPARVRDYAENSIYFSVPVVIGKSNAPRSIGALDIQVPANVGKITLNIDKPEGVVFRRFTALKPSELHIGLPVEPVVAVYPNGKYEATDITVFVGKANTTKKLEK